MENLRNSYVRYSDGRRTLFLVPLEVHSADGREAFLNFTESARNGISRDRRRHYLPEDGPSFGIAVQRAVEYAGYINAHAKPHNVHKFSSGDGSWLCFFAGPPPGRG